MVEISSEGEMVGGQLGPRELARGFIGPVSSSLVRRAGCPVAVIHSDAMIPDPQHAPRARESVAVSERRWHLTRRRAASD